MARQQIEIEPGTASWDAWIEHHKGTRTELVMVKCRHDARPFFAWTEFPPEAARRDQLLKSQVEQVAAGKENQQRNERPFNTERDIEAIADRLENRETQNLVEKTAADLRTEKLQRIDDARERAAAAVQIGNRPNLGELDDVGVVMIDDPYEVRRGRKPKPLRAKLVNLRDDPVGQMAKRGQIEQDQLEAARKWQAVHDVAASVGATGGNDPFQMKVSGGKASEPINDTQIGAMKQLLKLDAELGRVGAFLVRQVLGERRTIKQVAAMMGDTSKLGLKHVGFRLRECLTTLVAVMNVEAKGRGSRSPRDENAELARWADNPLLYQAVHASLRKIV